MPPRLKPKDQKRYAKAKSAVAGGRFDEAIGLYIKLREHLRNEPGVLLPLAQCYIARRRLDAALPLLDRLVKHHPTHGALMIAVGRAFEQLRRPDRALSTFEFALDAGLPMPQQLAVRASIASACERLNDLPRARPHAEFLLEQAPDSFTTQLMAGILERREGDLASAEARLRQAIELGAPTPELQARVGYELARVLDRQGRYDDAYAAAETAKQIELPGQAAAQRQSEWVASLTTRLTELFQPQHDAGPPARTAVTAPPCRPLCLLTGHPRSGTTLLEQMLDSHSQMASADETSTLLQQVFQPLVGSSGTTLSDAQRRLEGLPESRIAQARTNYLCQLETITGDRDAGHWLIDKNPEAVMMIPALQRAVPGAKVVMVIRDPRDVVLSCYFQHLSVNPVSVNYDTLANTASKYARTMALWLAMRGKLEVPWIEVRYEDLVGDAEAQLRRVLEFLDLSYEGGVLEHDRHVKEKVVRSPTYHAVAKPVYRDAVGRWRRYEAHFGPAFTSLAPYIDAFGYEA